MTRASGSHGDFDLVGIPRSNTGPCVGIQCKYTKDLASARRLMKAFKANPPLPPGEHVQILEVRVKGEREILEVRA